MIVPTAIQQRVLGIGWTSVVDLPLGSHSEFLGSA
jgi:hypothetical protein